METAMHGRHVPVAGPITGVHRAGKGKIGFIIQKISFSLPENSTFARMIKGAARAIVVYEDVVGEDFPRVIEVIPNYTGQQVFLVNSRYFA